MPNDTLVFGACSGNIPIPLIYQDLEQKLIKQRNNKSFDEKEILCSFVGTTTHPVRHQIINFFQNNSNFRLFYSHNWTPVVSCHSQDLFVNVTCNSKFTFAPRGYGRSSFRFFEIFLPGSIPIYVWDDKEWLPYMDEIDYSKFCISIHISKLSELENILKNINQDQYNNMLNEYEKIKKLFYFGWYV